MNRTLGKRLKTLGFLRIGWCGVSEVNDTTPSPSLAEGAFETSFGPPPTRPTHQTEKANLPNGNTLTGVTKQSYCRVLEPIFPTGTKAPESLAATLHAAADESESLRFMGTINFCLRKSSLSMNLSVLPASCRQKTLGSADETSAARSSGVPLALRRFMAPMRVQCRWLKLPGVLPA